MNDSMKYHGESVDSVFRTHSSSSNGLSGQEAEERFKQHGPNRLTPQGKQNPLVRFLLQFRNILIYVLLVAGAVTALLGHWIDAWVIIGVVVINALIGYVQEGKAEKALDAIRDLLSPQALVRRGGMQVSIPSEELVPGDVVILQSGDKVPADVRLFSVRDLKIDEAILTGESLPTEKKSDAVSAEASIGDRTCMAFSGTLVTYGRAEGVVVETGDGTQIGRISTMLGTVETLQTPLMRRLEEFARTLSIAIVSVSVLLFLFGVFARGYSVSEMFNAAVGIAVAAIPEGLPAIMTIALAIGVQAMARRKAIIRKLPAVETLGSVSVICSDKTGTLTRNEMTVRSLALSQAIFDVTGSGYIPDGAFLSDGRQVDHQSIESVRAIAQASLLCNDASVRHHENQWLLSGDPTEGALYVLGMKAGYDPEAVRNEWPRIDMIPFESEHRFMATLHHDHHGHGRIYMKGAPEVVLSRCARQRNGEGEGVPDLAYWDEAMRIMASQGQRLLAIASKEVDPEKTGMDFSDVADDFLLLGITGMIDPPREEAITAVQACKSAGIRVKMITGDHVDTAKSIGAMIGIGDGRHAVTGAQIEQLDDSELEDAVLRHDVFARSSPEHKLRLVKALQARGHVVAMTGDGVNDAPALKRADVGIAMGLKGTEVSKEAAEMVLADDNFATIASAIEQGRTVYDNLKKSILFILPTNGGEALSILFAIALGYTLPVTAVQILWVNMVTAVTLALSLAFEPAEANVMRRKPRKSDEPILSRYILWRIMYVSILLMIGTFGLFLWYERVGYSHEFSRTVAVTTLVMLEVFYLFSSRFFVSSVFSGKAVTGNPVVLYSVGILLVLQALFIYAPFMQKLFATRPLGLTEWVIIMVVGFILLLLVELEKFIVRTFFNKAGIQ
ncbi:MAG: cation-transporting P-type ATPase [Chlorobi bacterium]|nr:cation-transporting P-type ATPase [Chlorobiota bacterium]